MAGEVRRSASDPAEPAADQRFSRYVLPELDPLLRLALSLTGQEADAEDLVQDTVLRAFRSIDKFDGSHPRAWLFTIMRHTYLNNIRHNRRYLLLGRRQSLAARDSAAPAAEQPERQVTDRRLTAPVAAALRSLPRKHQDVIRLVDIAGLDYNEAGEVLHTPPGTVASRLHRARAKMRAELGKVGLDPKPSIADLEQPVVDPVSRAEPATEPT